MTIVFVVILGLWGGAFLLNFILRKKYSHKLNTFTKLEDQSKEDLE